MKPLKIYSDMVQYKNEGLLRHEIKLSGDDSIPKDLHHINGNLSRYFSNRYDSNISENRFYSEKFGMTKSDCLLEHKSNFQGVLTDLNKNMVYVEYVDSQTNEIKKSKVLNIVREPEALARREEARWDSKDHESTILGIRKDPAPEIPMFENKFNFACPGSAQPGHPDYLKARDIFENTPDIGKIKKALLKLNSEVDAWLKTLPEPGSPESRVSQMLHERFTLPYRRAITESSYDFVYDNIHMSPYFHVTTKFANLLSKLSFEEIDLIVNYSFNFESIMLYNLGKCCMVSMGERNWYGLSIPLHSEGGFSRYVCSAAFKACEMKGVSLVSAANSVTINSEHGSVVYSLSQTNSPNYKTVNVRKELIPLEEKYMNIRNPNYDSLRNMVLNVVISYFVISNVKYASSTFIISSPVLKFLIVYGLVAVARSYVIPFIVKFIKTTFFAK